MTNTQQWFDQEFPKDVDNIKIDCEDFEENSLIIEDYPNLAGINISNSEKIKQLTLKNLPKLERFRIYKCETENLTIENCPKLGSLNVRSNLLTNLNFLKNLPNLQKLEIDGNQAIKSGWEYLPINLEKENFTCTNTNELLTLHVKYRTLKNSVKDILTHLVKNKHSLTTQEVLNQFSHHGSTKEIVTNLGNENKSLIQEHKWLKPQFANQTPTLEKKLGQGAFGEVWAGTWKTQPVAIKKTLHLDESMKEELKLLRDLKSKYIIQYYGEYQQGQEWLIIMELAENGSLCDFIEKNKNNPHNWQLNYNFIRQMVKGLSYLHAEGVIHCDLKSLNVLLTEGNIAKLSDFGISQIIKQKNKEQAKSTGTTRWMAPELLVRNQPNSFASDIYSLGMVMWELVAKKTVPFSDLEEKYIPTSIYCRGEREEIPTDTPPVLKEVIADCWKNNLQERISLAEITSKFEEVSTAKEKLESDDEFYDADEIFSETDKQENLVEQQTQIQIPPK